MGLLINVTTPSDKIAPNDNDVEIQHTLAEVVGESGATNEEVELRNAIERDLFQLTIVQSEIERDLERLEAIDAEERKDAGIVKIDDEEEMDGQDAESVEDENESEEGNEQNEGSKCGDAVTESGTHNQSNNRGRFNYPMRPDAEDCAYYMKFGACKFGLNCKFNHPLRRKNKGAKERANHREENLERAGQTENKYYVTSRGCKYGMDYRHSHGLDNIYKSHTQEFNFLGLPIRPGEKECPYYMRNGSCKYGSNCRFHHPEPSAAVGTDSSSEYRPGSSLPSQLLSSSSVSSWSSPRAYTGTYPFTTTNSEWSQYRAANYPKSESGLPTPPAFALNNLATEINFPKPYNHHAMVLEEYPQRPGEPDCTFFLRTGDCTFKSNCKFHHPKYRISKPKAKSLPPSNKGPPLRPDQPLCTFYYRHGFCKYGPGCRFNHPPNES